MPLLPTTSPVLLLPVRLETRFIDGANGPELWVRIYPDQIAIDTHEPALTAAEQTAGEAYWNEAITHSVENIGSSDVHNLIIELKSGARCH